LTRKWHHGWRKALKSQRPDFEVQASSPTFRNEEHDGNVSRDHRSTPVLHRELLPDDIIDPQIREVELRNWLRFIDSRVDR
jgi:hypothetical protein